jgi:ligand-binding sensor domain-containing protein
LPYNNVLSIAEGNGKIYCASRYALFSYDKNDGALERFSRITGLNDLEIGTIRYNSAAGVLLIAYQSSNIDLLYNDGTVVNLSDIKRKNIVGGKSINHIMFSGKYAYLSCNFGIVVIDLERQEIKDTYYIGRNGNNLSVNQFAGDGTTFYAATDSGIMKASASNPFLFNFESWSLDTTVTSVITNATSVFSSVAAYSGKIFAVKKGAGNTDTLIQYDGTSWAIYSNSHTDGSQFETEMNHLIRKDNSSVEVYNNSLNSVAYVAPWYYTNGQPLWGYVDIAGIFWIADGKNGLVKFSNGSYEFIYPNGPNNIATWAMAANKDNLWVVSGGISGQAPRFKHDGVYFYTNYNEWKNFIPANDPLYASLSFADVVCIAMDTSDTKHAFIGSWGGGLLEYRNNGVVQVYNESNSTLRAIADTNGSYRPIEVGGVAFDSDNNLWVANASNYETNSLSVRKNDGSWQSFHLPTNPNLAAATTYGLLVDSYNQKWLNASIPPLGIGVFFENDMANPNDDSVKIITNQFGNGNLPSLNTLAMAEDKDGAIWIGSDKGVAVIYNPGNIFTGGDYDAQKVLIEQEGHAQYLLENEFVWAIAVDGANRKWFGTQSGGAFLMSADGTKQLLHFNTDNSPLLSNFVISIAIDPNSGEVFFGTFDKGICSYRADATEGGEACDNYYVFPNPVKHDYSGPIAIKGLVANASVKITDVSGQLVYQTKANGGEAIWNGKNFKGEKAHTGVYTVFITNEDGSATCTTKMLFVN